MLKTFLKDFAYPMGLAIGAAFWMGRKIDPPIDKLDSKIDDPEKSVKDCPAEGKKDTEDLGTDFEEFQNNLKELLRRAGVIKESDVAAARSFMQAIQSHSAKQKDEAIEKKGGV